MANIKNILAVFEDTTENYPIGKGQIWHMLNIPFMANRWGNSGNGGRLYFFVLQNHCQWWLQP